MEWSMDDRCNKGNNLHDNYCQRDRHAVKQMKKHGSSEAVLLSTYF